MKSIMDIKTIPMSPHAPFATQLKAHPMDWAWIRETMSRMPVQDNEAMRLAVRMELRRLAELEEQDLARERAVRATAVNCGNCKHSVAGGEGEVYCMRHWAWKKEGEQCGSGEKQVLPE